MSENSVSQMDSNGEGQYAVSVEDLFWSDARSEEEALKNARKQIEQVDVNDLDLSVVDYVDEAKQ